MRNYAALICLKPITKNPFAGTPCKNDVKDHIPGKSIYDSKYYIAE